MTLTKIFPARFYIGMKRVLIYLEGLIGRHLFHYRTLPQVARAKPRNETNAYHMLHKIADVHLKSREVLVLLT